MTASSPAVPTPAELQAIAQLTQLPPVVAAGVLAVLLPTPRQEGKK